MLLIYIYRTGSGKSSLIYALLGEMCYDYN